MLVCAFMQHKTHLVHSYSWALFQDNAFAFVASSEGWDSREDISDVASMWLERVCVCVVRFEWVEEDVGKSIEQGQSKWEVADSFQTEKHTHIHGVLIPILLRLVIHVGHTGT